LTVENSIKSGPKCTIPWGNIQKIFWGGGKASSPDPTHTGEGDTPSPYPTLSWPPATQSSIANSVPPPLADHFKHWLNGVQRRSIILLLLLLNEYYLHAVKQKVARACYKRETKTLVDKWISREKLNKKNKKK